MAFKTGTIKLDYQNISLIEKYTFTDLIRRITENDKINIIQ